MITQWLRSVSVIIRHKRGINYMLERKSSRVFVIYPQSWVIFDMISIKARWERWCRWNCDLRVINARKKGIFCCTESVAMTPKSRDHMPTTSLWGVAAKWPTGAPKTKLILCQKDPARIQPYQFEPVRQDFERVLEHRVSFEANPMRYFIHWSARYTNGLDAGQQESQIVWIV